jgi:hypothetical protein
MSRRRVANAAFAALVLASGAALAQDRKAAPEDRFADVRFLVGRWTGTSEGVPGRGTVTRTYEPVLGGRFLQERHRSEYPATEKKPTGEVHEHWSLFSYDKARKAVMLRQFHQEGFVNTYRLLERRDDSKVLVFETEQIENLPEGWKARETYEPHSADELTETFELSAPGKPFEVYSKTRFRREG